jgi:hypothetical protein
LNELLQDWIIAITGYDDQHVIRANQNGPRPTEPYATYQIISETQADFSYWDPTTAGGDDVTSTFIVPAMLMVSVDVFAPDGLDKLSALGQSKNLVSIRNLFGPGIVLRRKRETRDLTELGDTRWRPRYQADFDFARYNELTEGNKRIIDIELTGKIENDDVEVIV